MGSTAVSACEGKWGSMKKVFTLNTHQFRIQTGVAGCPLGISGGRLPSGQVRQLGRLGVWERRGAGSCQSPSSYSWLTQTHYSHWDTPRVSLEAAHSHTPCSVQCCGFTVKLLFCRPPPRLHYPFCKPCR